jgi:hypothetical protein
MGKIILAILVVFAFYLINKWLTKNCYTNPIEDTFFIHERLHGDPEKEVDEHDPSNLDLDKSLKMSKLQSQLRETEIDDVNLDYQNPTGK